MLRRNFGRLVSRTKESNDINSWGHMSEVYEGTCSRQYFHKYVIPDPIRVAFISRPIIDAGGYYEAINRVALTKILEIVRKMPANEKNLTMLLRTLEKTGERAYGAVVQQINMKTKNLNIEAKVERELPPGGDNLDLANRLEAAKSKLLEAPRDVSAKPEDEGGT